MKSSGMSSHHSHAVSRHCDHTQGKIHTIAELLLLSGQFRPIQTENTGSAELSLTAAREQINSSLSIILEIVHDITRSMVELKTRWKIVCDMLFRLSDAVTVLVELCYFVTYQQLVLSKSESSTDPPNAVVDKYTTTYAGLEIKLSCLQIKRARLDELNATFIMDICSNISKYISMLTENCRNVSEHGPDPATRDQFKLGIKSVTCAAGSLIASIKSYKSDRCPRHHCRVVTFCEPVLAASHALVCLATEEEFVEPGHELSTEEREIQKSIFGPCMNIVSGCVQICKSLRDFTYDTGNSHYINKTKACHSSIVKSSNHLKQELHKHFSMEFTHPALSSNQTLTPTKGDNQFKDTDNSDSTPDNHRDLSPFGRCSPLPVSENSGKEEGHDLSPRSADVSFSTGISR